jgi:SMI1/KNR4 family protein SUKH-1
MNWTRVLEFIDSADPSFAAKMRGVQLQDIDACEAGLNIRLPETYRQFLLTMGVHSGDFHPIAASQNHSFYDVMELLPEEDYPADRYFRVSFASDESQISPPDYFLDLARSDGDDAPLVIFEGGGGFKPDSVRDTGFTFGEHVMERVFQFFEFDRRSAAETILISNLPPDEARNRMGTALDLLTRMRFDLVLPPLPRVACLRRGGMSAVVAVRELTSLLRIRISSADRKELSVLVDQILLSLPGAELYSRKR